MLAEENKTMRRMCKKLFKVLKFKSATQFAKFLIDTNVCNFSLC